MPRSLGTARIAWYGTWILLAARVILAFDQPSAPAGPNRPADDAQIAKLIQQLGDSQYHAREKAQDELRRLGSAAFDALLAAQDHEDIEIAMRARYLVRSLPIAWTKDADPAELKQLFKNYSEQDRKERLTRAQHFATLENYAGTAALCRIMRFDADRLLSKQAAILVLQASWPETESRQQQLAKLIRDEVASSKRPGALWLNVYARSLEAPVVPLAEWERLANAELDLLAKNPQQTDPKIARDLLRSQAQWQLRLQRDSDALATVRRTFDLITEDRQDLYELLDWCVERELHRAAEELAVRFAVQFQGDPQLLYRLAESQLKRGQREVADATADRARQLEPTKLTEHLVVAATLQRRMLTEWADREYRFVVERTKSDEPNGAVARWELAEMLFDWGKELEAAQFAQSVADAAVKNSQVYEFLSRFKQHQVDAAQVQGYTQYYFGMHFARLGNRDKQIEYFRKAIEHYPTNTDFLIAMFRVPDPDDAWRTDVKQRIEAWSGTLRKEIREYEESLQRPMDEDQRGDNGRALANTNNELAWLLSNTEGDLKEALLASLRSLELMPDYPPYLDTLGRCYYALGDYKNAVKYQSRAVQLIPKSPAMQSFHVMLRQLTLFEKALADSPAAQPKPEDSEQKEKK